MGLPVVVIRGILESGKTTFLTDSLINGDFGDVGKTLILSQEEGETLYDSDYLKSANASVVNIDSVSDWNLDNLNRLVASYKPQVSNA